MVDSDTQVYGDFKLSCDQPNSLVVNKSTELQKSH